jgi:hypothetical protein
MVDIVALRQMRSKYTHIVIPHVHWRIICDFFRARGSGIFLLFHNFQSFHRFLAGFCTTRAPKLKSRAIRGFTWRSSRNEKKHQFLLNCAFFAKYSELGQMNATTVLSVTNFTTHVFFGNFLQCSFFHGNFDFYIIVQRIAHPPAPYACIWTLKLWTQGPRTSRTSSSEPKLHRKTKILGFLRKSCGYTYWPR